MMMFYDMFCGRWENYNLHEKDQAFHRMNVGSNLRQSQRDTKTQHSIALKRTSLGLIWKYLNNFSEKKEFRLWHGVFMTMIDDA